MQRHRTTEGGFVDLPLAHAPPKGTDVNIHASDSDLPSDCFVLNGELLQDDLEEGFMLFSCGGLLVKIKQQRSDLKRFIVTSSDCYRNRLRSSNHA